VQNKHALNCHCNQKNFIDNPEIVSKTINKEDRYSHLIPMDELICLFSPYCRHTSQGIALKEGKDPRVVWDGTTKSDPYLVVMNDIMYVDDEVPTRFGEVKLAYYIYIYNLRISYPRAIILWALADAKAYFRFPRVHPDLTRAFGFLVDGFYNLAQRWYLDPVPQPQVRNHFVGQLKH